MQHIQAGPLLGLKYLVKLKLFSFLQGTHERQLPAETLAFMPQYNQPSSAAPAHIPSHISHSQTNQNPISHSQTNQNPSNASTQGPASYSTNQQPPGFEVGEQKLSKELPKPTQPNNASFTAQAPSSGMQVLFKLFTDIIHKLIYSFDLKTPLNWKPHLSVPSSKSASTRNHHVKSGLLLLGCRANFFTSY